MKTLSNLKIDETGIISDLKAEGFQRMRLMDLGFIKNSSVKKVNVSPAGDPSAYEIKGTVIALRKDEADKILLKEENEN